MTRLPSRTAVVAVVLLLSAALLSAGPVGCKKDAAATGADGKVSLQLNWKPEAQFGGFYAAGLPGGAFEKHGLNVAITPGGVGIPTVQMVGSGQADFALVSADEVVMARAKGNDVVALLAIYQDCPQGLMTRADRGFTQIGDVFKTEGTVGMQKGLPYARMLEKQYGFDKVKVVPTPGGDLSVFLKDPTFTQQCFVTSEPLAAKKAGVETRTFLVKEAGYNPYTTVLVTRGEVVRKNPQLVLKMATACREGWDAYLADPTAANEAMHKLNPSMDPQTMADGAGVQKPLVLTEETKANGVGHMTLARWEELIKQLAELGIVKKSPPAAECFVDLKTLK